MPVFPLSEIKKLSFDFETEVRNFVQAKKDHLNTEGVPAPTHHPWVEASVRRIAGEIQRSGATTIIHSDDFVPDYQIVDDTPPPPTLDDKKAKLAQDVGMQANALAEKILPRLKRKLFDFQAGDAAKAIALAQEAQQEPDPVHKFAWDAHLARQEKVEAIYRHAAELESQIHDLTEDQVDVWQGAPFPSAEGYNGRIYCCCHRFRYRRGTRIILGLC